MGEIGIPLEAQRTIESKWRFLLTALSCIRNDLDALDVLVRELAEKEEL